MLDNLGITGMLNETVIKKILRKAMPDSFRKGMNIEPADIEDKLSGGNLLQETFASAFKGNNHDEFIGFLMGLILSWDVPEIKEAVKAGIEPFFRYLQMINYQEDNKQLNRFTEILLTLFVLLERKEDNV